MKLNFFKYVFILFTIGIIIFAIYILYFKEDNNKNEMLSEQILEQEQIKELRLGISNFDTINPLLSDNKEVLNIGKLIFEPLVTLDEDYKINLCLATECSKISDTSYIIKIDNNKKWQNGTSLIAKDIQFTIDRLKEGKSIYSYNVEKVSSVEVVDASTVRINLSEPVPFFEYNLTFPILSNNYYMGQDFNTSDKNPMGTGMFKISSIDENNIMLEKNDNWWNKQHKNSKIEKIDIKLYKEVGELYNSFKLGNIDVFNTSNINLEQYIGTIGYVKNEYKGREFTYLALNCANTVLKDNNVRKAISYAIDKNNIVSAVYNNECYTSNFPLDYGSYLYDKETVSSGYNPEQAKTVLLNSGWQYKNNRWQKKEDYKTVKLKLNLTVNATNTDRVAVAENIKAQLEQIGINVTINKVSDSSYRAILENKNYEMIVTGVYNSYSPDINTFFGKDNLQNYENGEINNILRECEDISDDNLLKEKYKRIVEIYESERPFIGLYRNKVTIVKSQNLVGEIVGNNYFSYYRLESWYRI